MEWPPELCLVPRLRRGTQFREVPPRQATRRPLPYTRVAEPRGSTFPRGARERVWFCYVFNSFSCFPWMKF